MFAIRTILHATDFSDRSEQAFRLACSLAADYSANLVLVHVFGAPSFVGGGVILPGAPNGGVLRQKLDELDVPHGSVDVTRVLERGNPAVEVLRVARACRADLIVIGTHGRRGLTRLLMGSVAEEIVRQAKCPVLTVGSTTSPPVEANAPCRAVVPLTC